jgi:hypothetical protein
MDLLDPKTKALQGTINALRGKVEKVMMPSRERSLALTKLDECEMWLDRCPVGDKAPSG